MRQKLQALNTIEVIDDKEESTEKFYFISSDKSDSYVITSTSETIHNMECTSTSETIHNMECTSTSETIHNTECTSTSETIHNTECTSTSETVHNTERSSTSETIHNTECTSTSETIHNTECTSTSETIHNTECTSTSETIHNTECTGRDVTDKEKLTTVLSNQELYDKCDKISRPSNWLPETVPEKEKEQEIDDFEYLGNLDDRYLLSLFEEEKIPFCTDVETSSEVNNTVTVNKVVEQAGSSTNSTSGQKLNGTSTDEKDFSPLTLNDTNTSTSEVNNSRRYNPPRRAKDGVEYSEDNDYLEEFLQSEYCKCLKSNYKKSFTISIDFSFYK